MDKATIIAAAPPAAAGVADPRAPPPEQESADQAAARPGAGPGFQTWVFKILKSNFSTT